MRQRARRIEEQAQDLPLLENDTPDSRNFEPVPESLRRQEDEA